MTTASKLRLPVTVLGLIALVLTLLGPISGSPADASESNEAMPPDCGYSQTDPSNDGDSPWNYFTDGDRVHVDCIQQWTSDGCSDCDTVLAGDPREGFNYEVVRSAERDEEASDDSPEEQVTKTESTEQSEDIATSTLQGDLSGVATCDPRGFTVESTYDQDLFLAAIEVDGPVLFGIADGNVVPANGSFSDEVPNNGSYEVVALEGDDEVIDSVVIDVNCDTGSNDPVDLGPSGTDQTGECAADYYKVESTSSLEEGTVTYIGTSKDGASVTFVATTTFDSDGEADTITIESSSPAYTSLVGKAGQNVQVFDGNVIDMDKAVSNFNLCFGEGEGEQWFVLPTKQYCVDYKPFIDVEVTPGVTLEQEVELVLRHQDGDADETLDTRMVDGYTVFRDVSIPVGEDHILVAVVDGKEVAQSDPFDIVPCPKDPECRQITVEYLEENHELNGGDGTVVLPEDACLTPIILETFTLPLGQVQPVPDQELFEYDQQTVGPGEHTFAAGLPDCAWQSDFRIDTEPVQNPPGANGFAADTGNIGERCYTPPQSVCPAGTLVGAVHEFTMKDFGYNTPATFSDLFDASVPAVLLTVVNEPPSYHDTSGTLGGQSPINAPYGVENHDGTGTWGVSGPFSNGDLVVTGDAKSSLEGTVTECIDITFDVDAQSVCLESLTEVYGTVDTNGTLDVATTMVTLDGFNNPSVTPNADGSYMFPLEGEVNPDQAGVYTVTWTDSDGNVLAVTEVDLAPCFLEDVEPVPSLFNEGESCEMPDWVVIYDQPEGVMASATLDGESVEVDGETYVFGPGNLVVVFTVLEGFENVGTTEESFELAAGEPCFVKADVEDSQECVAETNLTTVVGRYVNDESSEESVLFFYEITSTNVPELEGYYDSWWLAPGATDEFNTFVFQVGQSITVNAGYYDGNDQLVLVLDQVTYLAVDCQPEEPTEPPTEPPSEPEEPTEPEQPEPREPEQPEDKLVPVCVIDGGGEKLVPESEADDSNYRPLGHTDCEELIEVCVPGHPGQTKMVRKSQVSDNADLAADGCKTRQTRNTGHKSDDVLPHTGLPTGQLLLLSLLLIGAGLFAKRRRQAPSAS